VIELPKHRELMQMFRLQGGNILYFVLGGDLINKLVMLFYSLPHAMKRCENRPVDGGKDVDIGYFATLGISFLSSGGPVVSGYVGGQSYCSITNFKRFRILSASQRNTAIASRVLACSVLAQMR